MGHLRGQTLRRRLQRQGPLSLEEAAHVLVAAMTQVASAHAAGLVHGDPSPERLLLVDVPGGGYDVRVTGFGLATVRTSASRAPRASGPEDDVRAFGHTLLECLPDDGAHREGTTAALDDLRRLGARMSATLEAQRPDLREAIALLLPYAARFERPPRPGRAPAIALVVTVTLVVAGAGLLARAWGVGGGRTVGPPMATSAEPRVAREVPAEAAIPQDASASAAVGAVAEAPSAGAAGVPRVVTPRAPAGAAAGGPSPRGDTSRRKAAPRGSTTAEPDEDDVPHSPLPTHSPSRPRMTGGAVAAEAPF